MKKEEEWRPLACDKRFGTVGDAEVWTTWISGVPKVAIRAQHGAVVVSPGQVPALVMAIEAAAEVQRRHVSDDLGSQLGDELMKSPESQLTGEWTEKTHAWRVLPVTNPKRVVEWDFERVEEWVQEDGTSKFFVVFHRRRSGGTSEATNVEEYPSLEWAMASRPGWKVSS